MIYHVQREIEVGKLMVEFPDVLTNKLGHTDLIEHEIEVFEDTKPIAQKPYRLSPAKEKAVGEQIPLMLSQVPVEVTCCDGTQTGLHFPYVCGF
jgi:hypothetical protein